MNIKQINKYSLFPTFHFLLFVLKSSTRAYLALDDVPSDVALDEQAWVLLYIGNHSFAGNNHNGSQWTIRLCGSHVKKKDIERYIK